jgi:hypothetical protein
MNGSFQEIKRLLTMQKETADTHIRVIVFSYMSGCASMLKTEGELAAYRYM